MNYERKASVVGSMINPADTNNPGYRRISSSPHKKRFFRKYSHGDVKVLSRKGKILRTIKVNKSVVVY